MPSRRPRSRRPRSTSSVSSSTRHRVRVRRVVQDDDVLEGVVRQVGIRSRRATGGTARRCPAPPCGRSAYEASTWRSTPPATRSIRSSSSWTSMYATASMRARICSYASCRASSVRWKSTSVCPKSKRTARTGGMAADATLRRVAELTEGSVRIAAPPAAILSVIADVAAYPEWAEGVRGVEVLSADPAGPARARRVPCGDGRDRGRLHPGLRVRARRRGRVLDDRGGVGGRGGRPR